MKVTDQFVVENMLSNDIRKREYALYQFYTSHTLKKMTVGYVLKRGGDDYDSESVFLDALCRFERKIREGKFNGKSKLTTYFYTFMENCWKEHKRGKTNFDEFKPEMIKGEVDSVEMQFMKKEQIALLAKVLDLVSERCQNLLKARHIEARTTKEIQEKFKLSSSSMAKKEIYRCLKRLRKAILKYPHLYKNSRN